MNDIKPVAEIYGGGSWEKGEVTLDREGLSVDAVFKQGTTNAKTQNRRQQMSQKTKCPRPHKHNKIDISFLSL